MRDKLTTFWESLLWLGLPLVCFACFIPANEYHAMGIAGVDCNGPFVVTLFALPLLAFYLASAIAQGLLLRKSPRHGAIRRLLLCLFLCCVLSPKLLEAHDASTHHAQQRACKP